MCRAHAAVRQLVGGMLSEENVVTVVDMEAGLEHLSRGTGRHVDTLVVMMEPYYRSLETARRTAELGKELEIPRIVVVANKIRDAVDREVVTGFARSHGLDVVAEIPFDDELRRGDQRGQAPIDTGAPALEAIEELAGSVVA